jgi:hypothetical protein
MTETSSLREARLTGVLFPTIIVTAMIAEALIRGTLIVPGDAAATAHNIIGSEFFYRSASALDLLVLFCDTLCAASPLCAVQARGLKHGTLLVAFFRLVFVAIMGIDGLLYFAPLTPLQGG